ncbi:MAG TPA: RsmE family RNA methyltransferase [Vicinamibacterales bacterium]|nr:RsmE family RNA methyltransferase [Vicinamibacterales bacterium]
MAPPRILISPLTSADRVVEVPGAEAHHLARVLRAGIGDEVCLFDGRGREWIGRLRTIDPKSVTVEIAHETTPVAEPHVRLTLAVGLLKGDQMDAVVRDATMLGVWKIVPTITSHVAVPAKAWKGTAVLERWRRVAVASVKQCGRAVVPEIAPVTKFAKLLEPASEKIEPLFMCVEPRLGAIGVEAVGKGDGATRVRPVAATVLIGPEGGWTKGEVEDARKAGATLVHLGPRTLRAETVPTVVLTALWTAWGW